MDVYLVRHGIAIDRDDPKSPPEEDRFLTQEGTEKTRAAVRGMALLGVRPRLVLSSPWLRARQTAALLMDALQIDTGKLRLSDALFWDADPQLLLQELASCASPAVCCVGHAPHLDDFIAHCIGTKAAFTSMKKASLAHLSVDAFQAGGAVLEALYTPKSLRLMR